jgi:hypothetical protein
MTPAIVHDAVAEPPCERSVFGEPAGTLAKADQGSVTQACGR